MRDEVQSSSGHLLLLLRLLLLDLVLTGAHLRNQLDDEGHDVFVHVETPGILQGEIRTNVFVTGVEGGCEEFLLIALDEEFQQFLDDLGVVGLLGSLDSIAVDLVLLGQVDTLLELAILPVEVGCDPAELK